MKQVSETNVCKHRDRKREAPKRDELKHLAEACNGVNLCPTLGFSGTEEPSAHLCDPQPQRGGGRTYLIVCFMPTVVRCHRGAAELAQSLSSYQMIFCELFGM